MKRESGNSIAEYINAEPAEDKLLKGPYTVKIQYVI